MLGSALQTQAWLGGSACHPLSLPSGSPLLEDGHLLGHLAWPAMGLSELRKKASLPSGDLLSTEKKKRGRKRDYLGFPVTQGFPTTYKADTSVINIFIKSIVMFSVAFYFYL